LRDNGIRLAHAIGMKNALAWVGLFFAAALATGCKKDEGAACFSREECAEGLACVGDALQRCEKCEGLAECTNFGKCTAKEGACVAASDEDCKKSFDCKERGPCTAKDGACIVGGDADCRQSTACTKDKFCVAKGNNCVMSDADRAIKEAAAAAAPK
jgi:hypothetical protein